MFIYYFYAISLLDQFPYWAVVEFVCYSFSYILLPQKLTSWQ